MLLPGLGLNDAACSDLSGAGQWAPANGGRGMQRGAAARGCGGGSALTTAASSSAAAGAATFPHGVLYDTGTNKWVANVTLKDGSTACAGIFDAPEAAAVAHDDLAVKLLGPDAPVNFSNGRPTDGRPWPGPGKRSSQFKVNSKALASLICAQVELISYVYLIQAELILYVYGNRELSALAWVLPSIAYIPLFKRESVVATTVRRASAVYIYHVSTPPSRQTVYCSCDHC